MSFEDSITESGPGFVGTKFCREWFDNKKFFSLSTAY